MCTQLRIDGYPVRGVPGLVNVVGARGIVWRPGVDMDDVAELVNSEGCLCPVDLEATAKRNGFKCDEPDERGNFTLWSAKHAQAQA